MTVQCDKCGRAFDLWTTAGIDGWHDGHDCKPRDTVADILTRHGVPHRITARGIQVEGVRADAPNTDAP